MGTLPQAPFFSRKMAPRFLEALNLWVRCRRRLFFSRKMAPRFPDAAGGAGAAGAGRILRSQPDPSPNAPRDQMRCKGLCCNFCMLSVKRWCHNGCRLSRGARTLQWMAIDKSVKCSKWLDRGSGILSTDRDLANNLSRTYFHADDVQFLDFSAF